MTLSHQRDVARQTLIDAECAMGNLFLPEVCKGFQFAQEYSYFVFVNEVFIVRFCHFVRITQVVSPEVTSETVSSVIVESVSAVIPVPVTALVSARTAPVTSSPASGFIAAVLASGVPRSLMLLWLAELWRCVVLKRLDYDMFCEVYNGLVTIQLSLLQGTRLVATKACTVRPCCLLLDDDIFANFCHSDFES